MSNKGKKYLTKFTPKQQKFIDQYTSKFGLLSARDCAIRAARSRSRELIINVHMLRQLDVPDLPH